MEKLISMTEFVLKENKERINYMFPDESQAKINQFAKNVINYAKFLKQPLTLGMFVPCDENENVLEEPNGIDRAIETGYFKDYQKAKEKVLFEGFEVVFDDKVRHTSLPIVFHIEEFKTVESMAIVGNEIELTESALKEIR